MNAGSGLGTSGPREGALHKGLMTTLVGHVNSLATMTVEEKRALGYEVAAPEWGYYLNLRYGNVLERFYDLSQKSVPWPEGRNTESAHDRNVLSTGTTASYLPYSPNWNSFGFLVFNMDKTFTGSGNTYTRYATPTQEQDVTSFVAAVLRYSEAEFRAIYQSVEGYDTLIAKFLLMKELINTAKNN